MSSADEDSGRPAWRPLGETDEYEWDEGFAEELVGCLVLVGITRLDPAGEVIDTDQMFGFVTSADRGRGIALKLGGRRDGETYVLPPQTDIFEPGTLGDYRLKSTGEWVSAPDYVCTWTVRPPMNG
jgi:hypothetical protein